VEAGESGSPVLFMVPPKLAAPKGGAATVIDGSTLQSYVQDHISMDTATGLD
jgi:hypothetical protein